MISKKMFLAGLCAVTLAGSMLAKNDMNSALFELVEEVTDSFAQVTEALERSRSAYGDKVKEYKKTLFMAKKKAIKSVKARLKSDYKSAKERGNTADCMDKKSLYRAFKEEVYRVWKSTQELPSF